MPRISQKIEAEASVTTTAKVELSPKLITQIQTKLKTYAKLHKQAKDIEAQMDAMSEDMENDFANAGEYEALRAGARVNVPGLGEIPLKRVDGQTTKTTDYDGIRKRFKITPKAWNQFVTEKPKEGYLSVSLPREKKPNDSD